MSFFSKIAGAIIPAAVGYATGGGSLLGAAGGLLGGLTGGGSSQGGTTTSTNSPWAPAQDWLQSNIQSGKDLQRYYQSTPFNAQQINAYGNLAAGNDYLNRAIPGLLQQMSTQAGFNRDDPYAKPEAFNFFAPTNLPASSANYGGNMAQNNLAPSSFNKTTNPYQNGAVSKISGAFDGAAYLRANPDVQSSPKYWNNPYQHYLDYGRSEGRAYPSVGD